MKIYGRALRLAISGMCVTGAWALDAQDLGFTWKADPTRLIVAAVRPSSAAAEGKFQKEDVIVEVEKIKVSTAKEFAASVESYAAGIKLKIQIDRNKKRFALTLIRPFLSPSGTADSLTRHTSSLPLRVKRSEVSGKDNLWCKDGQPFTGVAEEASVYGWKESEAEYVDGVWVSLKSYNPDGHLVGTLTYKDGRQYEGRQVLSYPGGGRSSSEWRDGRRVKDLRYHGTGGKMSETEVVADQQVSTRFYDPAGQPLGTLTWKDNQRWEGVEVKYHLTGQKDRELEYRHGKRVKQKIYHLSGKASDEIVYDDADRMVSWRTCDPSGQLVGTVTYEYPGGRIVPQGVYVRFHPDGRRAEEIDYRSGEIVRHQVWDLHGAPVPQKE